MHQLFRRHRYQTNFPVVVQTANGKVNANIIDVNESGARIEGLNHVRRGEKVTILNATDRISGTVRWVGSDRVGLSFSPLLSIRAVDSLRFAKKSSKQQRWSSVGLQEMR